MSSSPIEERLRLAVPHAGWLGAYRAALQRGDMDAISAGVIEEDSRFIADRACLAPDDARWGSSRVRTGAVMGAVQSGKTASMLGVLARSIDNGVNVVVVLAGTRKSLWLQTLQRVRDQLDFAPGQLHRRIFIPNPKILEASDAVLAPQSLYRASASSVARSLAAGKPVLIVAMKQVDHLQHLSQTMHGTIFPAAAEAGVEARLLVIDDEADDASVEDTAARHREADEVRWIPTRIRDLWASRSHPGETASSNVFATYIGYTATPQANFLQDAQNPLAPRDFVASLRTPGPEGSVSPRSLTYRVPGGLPRWYTGSDVYYGPLAESLLVTLESTDDPAIEEHPSGVNGPAAEAELDQIVDSARAFLTASAIRLARQPGKLGPATASAQVFEDRSTAEKLIAQPSSMLVHPSSGTVEHFAVADSLRGWWNGDEDGAGRGAGVLADLARNEESWRRWLTAYAHSSHATSRAYGAAGPELSRAVPEWSHIRSLIVDELVPATRVAVINSDPAADDRPSFKPHRDSEGWRAPSDHSTIFVSGNVMARGLTLEGLLTTLFTRSARAPLADSQMQMQRWFGYRGEYIDLCRVFVSARQADLFAKYAEADHALRRVVLNAMTTEAGLPKVTVLQGSDFKATGKIKGLSSLPLSPGRRPFVTRLNDSSRDDANLQLVADFLREAQGRGDMLVSGRGVASRRGLSLLEAAALLDGMHYDSYRAPQAELDRWTALEARLGLSGSDDQFPLFRSPKLPATDGTSFSPSPYSIAAYLRFWSASLERRVVGLMTDEDPPQKWRLLNLDAKKASQPLFRVGLRFGSGRPVSSGPIAEVAAILGARPRAMDRAVEHAQLTATWGSRGATEHGYSGDDLFDFQILGEAPRLEPDGSRRPGSPGLILFHLIDRDDSHGAIALGLSIPAGGPQHIEAVSGVAGRSLG